MRSLASTLPVYEETIAQAFRLSVIVPVYNERHLVEASLRRVLALQHELITSIEVVVVDDGSTDGSREILERMARADDRIVLAFHETNQGKGAGIRTGLARATGEIIVIHDADLEYNPADIPLLLAPFAKEGADAVFGSRYLSAPYRRVLMYRHTLLDKCVTTLGNWLTDLALTDLQTCYKAVNATLVKSIPLRSDDFRFEIELAFKLAKRGARIFEVPVRYLPRTFKEGKKIGARDGALALLAMLRFLVVDDVYQQDEYGSHILVELERARRFNLWMSDVVRPYVGERVLEIGAGIGNLTSQLIPRDLYVASDVNPSYLHYLRSYSIGKPYLRVMSLDAQNRHDFRGLQEQFDTVIMLNVLEHVLGEQETLRNVRSVLAPGGRAVILVPQHPRLYGRLDSALGHRARYTRGELQRALTGAGFRVERTFDFNRISVPGWWLTGKILGWERCSRVQLKIFDTLIPILKRLDHLWPWGGLSVVAVAVKE